MFSSIDLQINDGLIWLIFICFGRYLPFVLGKWICKMKKGCNDCLFIMEFMMLKSLWICFFFFKVFF